MGRRGYFESEKSIREALKNQMTSLKIANSLLQKTNGNLIKRY